MKLSASGLHVDQPCDESKGTDGKQFDLCPAVQPYISTMKHRLTLAST